MAIVVITFLGLGSAISYEKFNDGDSRSDSPTNSPNAPTNITESQPPVIVPQPPVIVPPVIKWKSDKPNAEELAEFKTQEYQNQYGLATMNSAEAYAILKLNDKPIAGSGVVVAVTDYGVKFDNQDLAGKGDGLNQRYRDNTSNNQAEDDHGTHVAGTIAANRNGVGMHGVAYNSKILSVAINLSDTAPGGLYPYEAFDYAINNSGVSGGAKVINASWGGGGGVANVDSWQIDSMDYYMKSTIKNNSLLVAAAGNNGGLNPLFPALFAAVNQFNGYIIAVAAVDNNKDIAGFSNRCGITAEFCLSAPGVGILSTVGNATSYDYFYGTSMAAPHVSGAAAVLFGAWPQLKAPQVSEILFRTADKSKNINGQVDEIYGQGILDLYKAVQYIGPQLIAGSTSISDSQAYNLESTSLSSDKIFGDAFLNKVAKEIQPTIFYDSYGRDYKAFLNQKITAQPQSSSISLNNLMFSNVALKALPIAFGKDKQTNLKLNFLDFKNPAAANDLGLKFSLTDKSKDPKTYNLINGFSFTHQTSKANHGGLFGMAFNADEFANIESQDFGNTSFVSQNNLASNPYQYFFANSSNLTSSSFVQSRKFNQLFAKHAFFDDKIAVKFVYQNSFDTNKINTYSGQKQNQLMDFDFVIKPTLRSKVLFSYGELTEFSNNMLNSKSFGAFENKGNIKTSYIKLASSQNLTKHLILKASVAEGATKINGNNQGIFRSFENVRSNSASFSLNYENFFAGNLGLAYSEPMRVYKGKLNYDIPIAIDPNLNVVRKQGSVSLVPQGKERNYEISYQRYLRNAAQIKFNFLMQSQLHNMKNQQRSFLAYANYNKSF